MPIPQVPSPLATIIASSTYDADWFAGSTYELQIQNAINSAAADGAERVLVKRGYNPSLVTFNNAVQMVREGSVWNVYDVKAYGAKGDSNTDDTVAVQAAMNVANAVGGGVVYFPPALSYRIGGNGLTYYSNIVLIGSYIYGGGGTGAPPAKASILYMPTSNAVFMLNPAAGVVKNPVFTGMLFSIFGNATALGIIDFTRCHGPLVEHSSFSGGTNSAGTCIKWRGGDAGGDTGFGTIHHCGFSTVDTFGSVFNFGGSPTDQPDGISITDCYGTIGKTLFKFESDASAIGGPTSLSVKGCRWEGGTSAQPFVAITTDAKGFSGNFLGNRWENTSTTGIQVTLQNSFSAVIKFSTGGWAPGSGGLTITDNSTTPTVWVAEDRAQAVLPSTAINGLALRGRIVTADATLNADDHIVFVDATSANVQISLPAPSTAFAKQTFKIIKIDSSANTVTVHSFPANINGVTNKVMHKQYQSVDVMNDGTQWLTVAAHGIAMGVMEVPAFSQLQWGDGGTGNGYLQIDGTPKLIISLNNTTQYQASASDFSPITSGGKTLGAVQPWGDITATGGFRQTADGFFQDNVVASQTNVELTRNVGRFRAARAGSVTGVVVHATEARTAGTLTIKVFKNTGLAGAAGSQLGTLTAVLDGTNTSKKATTQAKDVDSFAAGDELYLAITTDAGWLPVTSDIRAALEIED